MKKFRSESGRMEYSWFWIWLVIVLTLSIVLYSQTFNILRSILSASPLTEGLSDVTKENWAYLGLVALGGVLFSWRVVKVVVLHATPISFGMTVADGIHKENSRRGTFVSIKGSRTTISNNGTTDSMWLGAVLRAHPSSDKLVRSRLEFLILALPCDWSFLIIESRWMFRTKGHDERRSLFNGRMSQYLKSTELMPPDKYRREMVNAIKSIRKDIAKKIYKIDGLKWTRDINRTSGKIEDDFGQQLTYEMVGTQYVVREDSESDQKCSFDSVTELREHAKSVLNPT